MNYKCWDFKLLRVFQDVERVTGYQCVPIPEGLQLVDQVSSKQVKTQTGQHVLTTNEDYLAQKNAGLQSVSRNQLFQAKP